MSFVNKTVSLVSDEATFIKAFIKSITAEDSRITCEQTDEEIDAMFEAATGYPTFVLDIGDGGKIEFERSNVVNGYAGYYNLKASVNGISTTDTGMLYYQSSTWLKSDIKQRTWRYVVVSNDSMVLVLLGKYDTSPLEICRGSMIQVTSDDKSVTACGYLCKNNDDNMDILSQNLSCIGDTDNNMAVSLSTNRLPYSRQGGTVEVIKNKVVLQGDVVKTECGGLWDCTTVPAYTTLTIDGKLYYTVNNHTLMLCE